MNSYLLGKNINLDNYWKSYCGKPREGEDNNWEKRNIEI